MPKWRKILISLAAIIIVIITAFLIYINTAFISKNEAKEQLANYLNVKKEDIYFENIDLEMESNQYEIDFYYNNNEYEAKIDAKEGKIIYTNFSGMYTNNNNTVDNTINTLDEEISLEDAKKIALEHINLKENEVTLVKANEENDNGIMVYEIEYKDTTYEYDFDISKTGQILQYDKDRLND